MQRTTSMRKYWFGFILVILASFAVLGFTGVRIYQTAPPIPERVVTKGGREVYRAGDISAGQNVWQAAGGMEMGSVWGHGSYVAPDWTADWLHRESLFLLDRWSRAEHDVSFDEATAEERAALTARLAREMKANDYDATTATLTISDDRADAIDALTAHYNDVFARGRAEYAIRKGTLASAEDGRRISAFFFWSSWAAAANRPGEKVTYTNNWPHEPLIGNTPSGDTVVWTGVSILLLLAGIGAMATWHATRKQEEPPPQPKRDPLLGSTATPSQRAVRKYFWVVGGLMLAQVLLGMVTAHYGVEGSSFYGIPLDQILPYTVVRTWHLQLGIFWIATAWLATGLYVGPAVGTEPKFQRLGVNVLFGALLVVVIGSMAGQWLSVMHKLGSGTAWFWLGHSGYEYIDLGRLWQVLLLVGLFLWLTLVARSVWPALKRKDEQRPILTLFVVSAAAIASFYFAALGYGKHTNLAIAEYWRWWVVHLWVEGFFEVFATVVIAFLFARLGLVGMKSASRASVLSATIFLSGGIIGTLHHLYFSGTPTFVLALGSVFSALEVVPLCFLGYDAWENLKVARGGSWTRQYRWPIYFFVAVAFWNLVGAGLLGFMINPPVALYYMQGLNTTPVHGHAALFGVYGMLGIGLVLFCMRALRPTERWNDRMIGVAFWSLNIGLLAMVVLSVLPIGLIQTYASVEHGYAYARSPELMQQPIMAVLRWMRVPGDTLFAVGIAAIVLFILGLGRGRALDANAPSVPPSADQEPAPAE
jgi:nitric oxide reductase subunit B